MAKTTFTIISPLGPQGPYRTMEQAEHWLAQTKETQVGMVYGEFDDEVREDDIYIQRHDRF